MIMENINLNELRNIAYKTACEHGFHDKRLSDEHEIWKDVSGFEGYYKVSNLGRVKSLDRTILSNNGENMTFCGKILKYRTGKRGYPYVTLRSPNLKKTVKIHRLVAKAFIPNPKGKPQVNHIDENKLNNKCENLEWCFAKENCNHGTRNIRVGMSGRNSPSKSLPVFQFSLCGEFIKRWDSLCEIERQLGFRHSNVGSCCYGRKISMYGYIWCFEKNYSKEVIDSKVLIYQKAHTPKKVAQFSLDGTLIKVWESSKQIFRELGIKDSLISVVCNGKRKHSNGYIWKYV